MRDYITDNKQDAGVWKHLKDFTRRELLNNEKTKQVLAQERKESLERQ